jgi:hypothetical protein
LARIKRSRLSVYVVCIYSAAWQNIMSQRYHFLVYRTPYVFSPPSALSSLLLTPHSDAARDNCSDHWYSTVDSPVRRIRNELDALFPSGNNSLPPDSSCNLLATKNVFGRLLNGVPERSVCTTNAACNSVTGQFVHIEQSSVSRDPLLFGNWSRVVNRAIATTCLPPWQMDPNTLLCRFPTIATAGRLPL